MPNMPTGNPEDQDNGLPPPGSRWGSGAQSVLPYLTKTLQARPSSAPDTSREGRSRERDGHPVFREKSPPRSAA
jgi:hypothetical protein